MNPFYNKAIETITYYPNTGYITGENHYLNRHVHFDANVKSTDNSKSKINTVNNFEDRNKFNEHWDILIEYQKISEKLYENIRKLNVTSNNILEDAVCAIYHNNNKKMQIFWSSDEYKTEFENFI